MAAIACPPAGPGGAPHRARPTGPLRSASDAACLDTFEADLGAPLPADLRAWWLLSDLSANHWIPDEFAPVSLDEALETHEIWLLVAEQEGESFDENGQPEARYRRPGRGVVVRDRT
ncbi:SMI1/KNR4 family protein [Kitasatospora aureofaciens]|uniref:SMI1/KNR4 family protein n=1 Tax=Kitasatospora aureofaciens TaxID=1894 RepID=UPI000526ECCD|nr:SMI1/KNR4 family protein [Kitasatospora aureofaciens]